MSFGTRACAVAAAVVLGVLAGCGGGKSSAISKADYVKRVTERCKQYQTERAPLDKKLSKLGDPASITSAQLKASADDIVAVNDSTRSVIADLKGIPRPDNAADAKQLEQVFTGADEAVKGLNKADASARAGDPKALSVAFQEVDAGLGKTNKPGKPFGFSACG